MSTLLKNAHIVLDDRNEIEKGCLLIEGGFIQEVFDHEADIEADEAEDMSGLTLYPGFIDPHNHGAMGKDFICGAEAVSAVSEDAVKDGTTAFLASLTVLSHEGELEALKSLAGAKADKAVCLGIHMEGPYLSKEYKALMDERYLRDPSIEELNEMIEASSNRIRTMTVAPERKGMDAFIPYLCKKGIIPMIGHTACTCQQALQARTWGAKGFTHLYNAMSQHTHRNPGCATAAFLADDMYKEMILDGFHTDTDVVRMTYKEMGPEQIIMITDAMLAKGMKDGVYTFSGLKCRKEGIHVRVVETGRIAGSAFGMIDAVRFVSDLVHPSPIEICAMTSHNAAVLLKDEGRGNLNKNARADIAVLDDQLNVIETYVAGRSVYRRKQS